MTKFEAYFEGMRGKEVAIVGYGVSNRPIIPFLLAHEARVTVYDKMTVGELGEGAMADARRGVTFVSGEKYLERADGDVIFRSPGIHPSRFAGKKGKLTSEAEAFFEVAPCKIIGITGSDGKSTTTTLISKILDAAGYKTHLGGNIGVPLLPKVPEMAEEDIAVMELSSFQLMTMSVSPDVAVITNISPNHLDIHKDMDEYVEAKTNIFRHQKPGGRLVVNLDRPIVSKFEANPGCVKAGFSLSGIDGGKGSARLVGNTVYRGEEKIMESDRILIPGRHNVDNYMAAMAATADFVGPEAVVQVAESFGGVVHRLELVREHEGIRYYNSSIDSSPSRTNAALSVFKKKVVVILGGYDKQIPFEPLHDPVNEHAAAVVLMGATSAKISAAIGPALPRLMADNMKEAIEMATVLAKEYGSKTVLLSPACASFDKFKNFEERGNIFKALVREL